MMMSENPYQYVKESYKKTEKRYEYADALLREYAEEFNLLQRDSSDLSQLEEWLIKKLYKMNGFL